MARGDRAGQAARERLAGELDDVEVVVGQGDVGHLVDVQVDRQVVGLGDVEHAGALGPRVGGEVRAAAHHVDAAGGGRGDQLGRRLVAREQADLQRDAAAQPLAQPDQRVDGAEGVGPDVQVDVGADRRDAAGDVAADRGEGPGLDVGAVDRREQDAPAVAGRDEVVADAGRQPRRGEGLVEVGVRFAGGGEHAPAAARRGRTPSPGATATVPPSSSTSPSAPSGSRTPRSAATAVPARWAAPSAGPTCCNATVTLLLTCTVLIQVLFGAH